MTDPVKRSDELDGELRLVSTRQHSLLIVTLVFIIALSLAQSFILLRLVADTRMVVTAQIPGLREQIAARNRTIADQQYVLTEQAVPAILKLSAQVKALGGEPEPVILKPPTRKENQR